jgi:hypothetical protein
MRAEVEAAALDAGLGAEAEMLVLGLGAEAEMVASEAGAAAEVVVFERETSGVFVVETSGVRAGSILVVCRVFFPGAGASDEMIVE